MKNSQTNQPQKSGNQRYNKKNKYRGKGGYFKKRHFDNLPKIDREFLDVYKAFRRAQATIIRYVNPSSEEQLLWKLTSEHLSIKEIIGQLIYNSENHLKQFEHILSDQEEFLPSYNLNEQTQNEEFAERSLEILMTRFVTAKRSIEQLLKKTQNDDWLKSAKTNTDSSINLKQLVAQLVEHDQKCLDDIFLNLQRHQIWYKPVEVPEEVVETPEISDSDTEVGETQPEKDD